jgi:hypothetical protein
MEFNIPYNSAQKGRCKRLLNFAPARYMFDRKSYDNNSFFNFERLMDEFRDGEETVVGAALFASEAPIRKNDIVLTSGTLSHEKLLVLENDFNRNDAATIKMPYKKKGSKQYYLYNMPMHIDEFAEFPELCKDFYFLDNPRIRYDKYIMDDVEISCSCDYVNACLKNFQKLYFETTYGKAIPGSVLISITKDEVKLTFKDIKILC